MYCKNVIKCIIQALLVNHKTMKKLLFSIIVLTLLLVGISHAEISSPENIGASTQNKVEIKINKKLDEQKLKVVNVFEKSIQNLKDSIVRIESRISKMESENTNISPSKSLLDKAKIKLTSGGLLIEIIFISIGYIINHVCDKINQSNGV